MAKIMSTSGCVTVNTKRNQQLLEKSRLLLLESIIVRCNLCKVHARDDIGFHTKVAKIKSNSIEDTPAFGKGKFLEKLTIKNWVDMLEHIREYVSGGRSETSIPSSGGGVPEVSALQHGILAYEIASIL